MTAQLGPTQVQLWMDGDKVASTRIGALALERANRLSKHKLFCSILTREELILEQRAVCVMQWLTAVARSCDPLCRTVAECILPNRHLVPLLKADFKMSARVTKGWYSLLLTLLAVPTFKSHLAAAYCDTYRYVTSKYAQGMGVLERSGYALSVQFLNRVTYVVDLVQGRDLLGKLGKSILDTLMAASLSEHFNGRLNPQHAVLSHRRYSPCISDLKCVLNVKGMPRIFACERATFLDDWVASLSAAQLMDPHVWRHWQQGHVENESRGWVSAFNASISLGSLFERLLGWADDEASPIDNSSSPYSSGLLSCVEMTFRILTKGVGRWQKSEVLFYEATPYSPTFELHRQCPNSLPFSTVASNHGTALAMQQIPIAQITPFSFHLPLHRFVASCIRELCLRSDDAAAGVQALKMNLCTRLSENKQEELYKGLLEFPLLVLSRASQIRAGLFKRNGQGLNDQVLNYAEPPFCRTMRDADLLLVQFATVVRGDRLYRRSDVSVARFVNLLIHRLGLFDFLGLSKAPDSNINRYNAEIKERLYPKEIKTEDSNNDDPLLPWAYSPTNDASTLNILTEEFLHIIIMFTSELPLIPAVNRKGQTEQARWKLHREVIHRLASGGKTHSELSEVQHVLSNWDNSLLNEEGKLINPDDASGAVLGTVLEEVGVRKQGSRERLEPDKWELKPHAWDSYDPSFIHISLRCHQTTAENRPKPERQQHSAFGWKARPYSPRPPDAHPFFRGIRRDTTADATVIVAAYRVLHMHCRENIDKDRTGLVGKIAYDNKEMSETAIARAVHILTLGAYAWMDADANDTAWREKGGGSVGSIFFDRTDEAPAPVANDWICGALLSEPQHLMDCTWYTNEDNTLVLLKRLAVSGGAPGCFVAQDPSVRAGAAWLCEFAVKFSSNASVVCPTESIFNPPNVEEVLETETDRRKRLAKEKAMAQMKLQAAKFASLMDVELDEGEGSVSNLPYQTDVATTPQRPLRPESIASAMSSTSSVMSATTSDAGSFPPTPAEVDGVDDPALPDRLFLDRPRCIICNYEETSDSRPNECGEGQRKRSRRRTENALGFFGYAQASTVMKGGGGPPPEHQDPFTAISSFVGTHIALCGHAVHSECCESYLTTVSHREDRAIGKRDEFRCPLCQRLSNCLVPFIDVGVDWIESPRHIPLASNRTAETDDDVMQIDVPAGIQPLVSFLSTTPWWVTNQNAGVVWDNHSAFIVLSIDQGHGLYSSEETSSSLSPSRRRSVRSLKKKDLYAAWNAMMRTPRFVKRRLRRRGSGTQSSLSPLEPSPMIGVEPEESTGETIVWRRFMDQISDISYRADGKRLSDERLHEFFGEFRHYIVEKYAYNMANRAGNFSTDVSDSKMWGCGPDCHL
jgi:hypothetical protein